MSFTRVGKCKSGVPAEECILSKSIYARAVLVKFLKVNKHCP